MLQRIQTLWTLLAIGCAILTLKFSFFSGNRLATTPAAAGAKVFEYLTATKNVLILIFTVIIIVAGAVNIFNYKNRKLQLRLTWLLVALSVVDLFLYYQESRKFVEGTYDLTALLTLAIPVCLILAVRGISRDNKLMKSADRLR